MLTLPAAAERALRAPRPACVHRSADGLVRGLSARPCGAGAPRSKASLHAPERGRPRPRVVGPRCCGAGAPRSRASLCAPERGRPRPRVVGPLRCGAGAPRSESSLRAPERGRPRPRVVGPSAAERALRAPEPACAHRSADGLVRDVDLALRCGAGAPRSRASLRAPRRCPSGDDRRPPHGRRRA